jgi:hypothetical protein
MGVRLENGLTVGGVDMLGLVGSDDEPDLTVVTLPDLARSLFNADHVSFLNA